jgi:4-hydroxybenzoate polyprenyltransferase
MQSITNSGLRAAFYASRPISWINTAAPFFLGSVLAGQTGLITLLGTIYFLFPYNVMLYGINDIFDYESDIKNPRKGLTSVEGSIVAKAGHRRLWWWIGITNIPFIVYFLFIGSIYAKAWFAILIFMAIAYSLKGLRFKEIPFLDSFTSSTHFYSPFVYGLLLAGSANFYLPALIAFVLWGMASHAFGAIQDITFDREAGIGSIGTVFGLRFTLIFCIVLYALAALLPAISYGLYGISTGVALSLYVLNGVGFLRLKSDAQAPETNRGWKNFLWLNIVVAFWIAQMLLLAFNPFSLSDSTLHSVSTVLIFIGLGLVVMSVQRIYRSTFINLG